ncbi:hypothetical protein I317_03162 [Kwoniella heveanensis CBS 569]|nr:hypothetical protein I317_03162 [Kwoniella heveanensis CBS 569]
MTPHSSVNTSPALVPNQVSASHVESPSKTAGPREITVPSIPQIGLVNSQSSNSVITYDSLVIKQGTLSNWVDGPKAPASGDKTFVAVPSMHSSSQPSLPKETASQHALKGQRTSLQVGDGVLQYEGAVWKVFSALLKCAVDNNRAMFEEIPVVIKIMEPDLIHPTYEGNEIAVEELDYTPSNAWAWVRNEDYIMRRLINLQGRVVPKFMGSKDSSKESLPSMAIMVMEDVGEQPHEPLSRIRSDFSCEEKDRIIEAYDELHKVGQVAHGYEKAKMRHILRRRASTLGAVDGMVVIDFQKAMDLQEQPDLTRRELMASDDVQIRCQLSYRTDSPIRERYCLPWN